eukprot:scaffold21033_cov49-Phaeocystis_antarctica.AAC.2
MAVYPLLPERADSTDGRAASSCCAWSGVGLGLGLEAKGLASGCCASKREPCCAARRKSCWRAWLGLGLGLGFRVGVRVGVRVRVRKGSGCACTALTTASRGSSRGMPACLNQRLTSDRRPTSRSSHTPFCLRISASSSASCSNVQLAADAAPGRLASCSWRRRSLAASSASLNSSAAQNSSATSIGLSLARSCTSTAGTYRARDGATKTWPIGEITRNNQALVE